MSNSTGTRKERNVQSRSNEAIIEADKQFVNSLKVFSEASNFVAGLAGLSVNNSPKTPAGNYLAREGDSMIGPLALGPPLDFTIEVDAVNTIDIGPLNENAQYTSNIQLDDLQPNSSVLDNIANAAFDGQILYIRTFAPTVAYTISQGTLGNGGNIQTGDSNDITLGDLQVMALIFDESLIINANTGGTWRVVSVSDATGGGTTFPLLYPKIDLTPPAFSSFTVDLSLTTGNAAQVQFPAGDLSFQIIGDPVATVAQEVHVMFIQDAIGGRSLVTVDSAIKNGASMDVLLDKAPNAKTTFKLVTLDGGVSYHAILVDLVSLTGGYTTILDDGSAVTNRTTMNFIGPNVTVVDNPGQSRTDITISTGSGALSTLTIDVTKSWLGFGIFDLGFLSSDAAIVPGTGFLRLGKNEEIRMKNEAGTDDLVFTSGLDSIGNQALIYQVGGANQLTISSFDIDVGDNDIVKTGDIIPGAGAHTVGDVVDFYNQMHSQYFVPEGSAVVTNRYGLAKNSNQLYVNFNDVDFDAGFGIREEGITKFLFQVLFGDENELFIGSDPFISGETYRIQMGENSNSSATISFVEGVAGGDLILDRNGIGTSGGVQVRLGGLTEFRVTKQEAKFFSDINTNAQDVINVVKVTTDGGGGISTGVIGEVVTNNGGFDYWMRNRISWDADPATFITFTSGGITLVSDDSLVYSSVDGQLFITQNSAATFTFLPNGIVAFTIQDNAVTHQDGISLFLNENFVSYQEISTPALPAPNEGRMYAKDIGGITTPFWLDSNGNDTNMLLGSGGGSGTTGASISIVKEFSLPLVINSTTLVDDSELKFTGEADTVYYIEVNAASFSSSTADIKYGMRVPSGATYRMAFAGSGFQFTNPGSSGSVTLNFDSVNSILGSDTFFVIVEMGSISGTVNLQFAQRTANLANTIVFRGSLMKVFEEGSSGSAPGQVIDIAIGVLDAPNFQYIDTNLEWFGSSIGQEGLDITLGLVEPVGFTFSYTFQPSDFNTGPEGYEFTSFSPVLGFTIQETAGLSASFTGRFFFNGVELSTFTGRTVAANGWASATGVKTVVNAGPGDIMALRLWQSFNPGTLKIRRLHAFTAPNGVKCTNERITMNSIGNNQVLIAGAPRGTTVGKVRGADLRPEFYIGGAIDNLFIFERLYGEGNNRLLFGEIADNQNPAVSDSVDSRTDIVDFVLVPDVISIFNYSTVTK